MTLPLSSLLYYDLSTIKHGDIKKGLKEYRLLLTALIQSIEAFEANELEKFDSLVGENACEIRAIRVALIHSNQSINADLKQVTSKIRKEISHLIENEINFLTSKKSTLKEIIETRELEIHLNKDEAFLFKSFIYLTILSRASITFFLVAVDFIFFAEISTSSFFALS